MTQITAADRVRAFGYVVIAGIYFYLAQNLAAHAARGFSDGAWAQLIYRVMLLFLLLVGFGAMARVFNRQREPMREMGLVFRPGWTREFGSGAAMGWAMLLTSILPMVLTGGLIVTFWTVPRQFGILLIDFLLLGVAALAEEVAFRGYPFQRLVDAVGPTLATLVSSLVFAGLHLFNPYASRASFMVTILASWLLSIAYLRTRALWLCWGFHFAWNASMCLLFGLPLSGLTEFSPVIQSNTVGPVWMTGGEYGPEASTVTAIVLLVGLFVVYRVTRKYAYVYNAPVIVAAGIPVDLDAMSSKLAPHHPVEAAVAPAGATLVQILPASPPPDPNIPR